MDTINKDKNIDLSNPEIRNQFISNYKKLDTSPISLGDLSNVNKPVYPNPTTPESVGTNAYLETLTNQYKESKADQLKQDEITSKQQTMNSSLESLLKEYQGQTGEQALTSDIYGQTGVDTAQKELDDINNQMIAEQVASRRKIEELEKNKEGMFGGALQQEKNKIIRESTAKQADLAVIQMAKQNNYYGAKEVADRAINAKLESQKQRMDVLKFLYEENKDLFTKAEQRQFETQQAERERSYDMEKTEMERVYDIALEAAKNGAPTSVITSIQNKKTSGEALTTAGGYMGVGNGGVSDTTQAIIENPSLFDDLTPTEKGKIITQLQNAGYDTSNLGLKGLSDTAIQNVAQTQKAILDLGDLRQKIKDNLQYVGPLKGLQAINPFSKSRQIQADVNRVRQTVGKALEGGVLRKEDEDKYKQILATLTDTPSTALYKIDALESSIKRDIENYKTLQGASGKSLDVRATLQKKGQTLTPEELRAKWNY